MTEQPRIGVTTSVRGGWTSWLFNRLAISRAGGTAVRVTALQRVEMDDLDAVVIGGGDDIGAELTGFRITPDIRIDPERDALESDLAVQAWRQGKPILGICRGAQMLNLVRGGTLHQDVHEVYIEAPRMRTVLPKKTIHFDEDSRLADILRCNPCSVNALHHQSVERPGTDLRIVARDEAGIVQGIETTEAGRFAIGVQWHPEYLPQSRPQQRIFSALVAAAIAGSRADTEPKRESVAA
jgi:putative glutamine amidotransferase